MKSFVICLLALVPLSVTAQVSINPDKVTVQAFEAAGKVKIGNDGATPTEGTLRYSAGGDFEGYTGTGWQSLTSAGSGFPPTGAVPVTGFINNISAGNVGIFEFEYADGAATFTSVPNNKFLLVTTIVIQSNGLATTGLYQMSIGPELGVTGFVDLARGFLVSGDRASLQTMNDPRGLLIIGRPAEAILAGNEATSDFTLRVSLRGYLVDSLVVP